MSLPSSSDELREALARVLAENARLSEENGQVRVENKLLREKIDALLRKLFGASSEKLDSGQLLLMLQGLDGPGKAPEPVAAEAPRRSTGQSPPRERGLAPITGRRAGCTRLGSGGLCRCRWS